ncbi:hypothetical protein WMY93_003187 [Mugilogobius chulae]|uniref:Dynactin subunit 5 n=1 Tax=Mugilogobius chulae TaxID=88201 RepID=A0AAW0QB02_9GOBI
MELSEILYNKAEYIETASGNKVSRQSVLCGSQNIVLNGKSGVLPSAHWGPRFYEEDCVVNAAQIGSYVHIGKNCVIGRRCVLKDCCKILDNTVLPPETVVPPFTVFSGCPGLFSGELPECTQDLMIDVTKSYYQKFLPLSQI